MYALVLVSPRFHSEIVDEEKRNKKLIEEKRLFMSCVIWKKKTTHNIFKY
jgi:hypothetical protein